jgi:hypothetical protein
LDKQGWDKDDLVIQHGDKVYWHLTRLGSGTVTDYIDAQAQQLLVLSDDEIQDDDWYLNTENKLRRKTGIAKFPSKDGRKIIASYPQLDGILSISKETVQAWIDVYTPKEGRVEMGRFYEGNYYGKCKACNKEFFGDKRWHYCKKCSEKQIKIDYQGNLLLELMYEGEDKTLIDFIKKDRLEAVITNVVNDYIEDKISSEEALRKLTAIKEPSISTDEEIAKKAHYYKQDYDFINTEIEQYIETAFFEGYKRALKDLNLK